MLDGGMPVQADALGLPKAPSFVAATAPGQVLTGRLGDAGPSGVVMLGNLPTLSAAVIANMATRDVIDVIGTALTSADVHCADSPEGVVVTITAGASVVSLTTIGVAALAMLQTASALHGETLIKLTW